MPDLVSRTFYVVGLVAVLATASPTGALGQTVRVGGTVRNAVTDRPVGAVAVIINDTVIALTAENGKFQLPPLPAGELRLTFRRIGYAPANRSVVPSPDSALNIVVALRPIAVQLREIVVDGQPVRFINPGLAGFYDRRSGPFGRFITAAEMSRRIIGLGYYLQRDLRVRPEHMANTNYRGCMNVYLDGMRYWDLGDITKLIRVRQVAAMEYYPDYEIQQLPVEFRPIGPQCGVLMVWTNEPRGPSPWAVGVRFGSVGTDGIAPTVGGHVDLAFSTHVALRVAFEVGASEMPSDRWRVALGVLRAFGGVYTGVGVVAVKGRLSELTTRAMGFVGVTVPERRLAPFGEVRVDTNFNAVNPAVFVGVNLRFTVP